ncbi:MAG: hypothetical protein KDA86_09460 [Planctomycetaceae bacterium]|nr:hypothetical protein [Planctomycetaceae bacterium]
MLSPPEIARIEESRQALATSEIAEVAEPLGGGWMCFAGVGAWANQASGVGLNGEVTRDEVRRMVEFYESLGVEPRIEVCPYVDASLLDGLADEGFVLREFENVLARQLTEGEDLRACHPFGWPQDVEIVHVDPADEAMVEMYARTVMDQFFLDRPDETTLVLARRTVRHPRSDAFIALVDGESAGGGGMESTEMGAALFGAGVSQKFRRRGIQLALMLTRLQRACSQGCRIACINGQPGADTERNAFRVGFQLAYTKAILVRPGKGLVPSP